jgi:two-component SAPR family response regulator
MENTPIQSIVLVDDDLIQKVLIQKRASKFQPGIAFDYFEEPIEAIEFLNKNKVDLVMIDLNLPAMSGWDLADEVHQLLPNTKIVLMSAYIDVKDTQRVNSISWLDSIYEKPLLDSNLKTILGL